MRAWQGGVEGILAEPRGSGSRQGHGPGTVCQAMGGWIQEKLKVRDANRLTLWEMRGTGVSRT